jgi:alanine racemase
MAVGDPRRVSRTRTGETAVAVPVDARSRPVWAEIDVGAVRHNAGLLRKIAAPAALCAVVKADAYGHGAVAVARAALDGGATWLAVATPDEGVELRDGGVLAPVLVLSEPPAEAMADVVAHGLTPAVYSRPGVSALAEASAGAGTVTDVHVKVDTGMHRVGATPEDAIGIALAVAAAPGLELQGLWTHFAVADEPSSDFTARQLARFLEVVDALAARGIRPPMLHASNSAGALFHPAARLDMVRCGVAVYGLAPSAEVAELAPCARLKPALSLRARVSFVKEVEAGEGLSYGLRYRTKARSVVATVPLGYADGVTRRLASTGGEVLIGGRRYPIAGSVTMDQIVVDCGPGADVAAGDVAVLLGGQGAERIGAWEWAERTDTIAYEVICGVSARVPRIYRS